MNSLLAQSATACALAIAIVAAWPQAGLARKRPRVRAGDLLRARRIPSPVGAAGRMTRILYRSADGRGRSATVSGTDIDAQTTGLTVTDHHFPVLKPLPNRVYATGFKQHVDERTVAGTYTWDCKNVGPARGKPGWVVLEKAGETATASIVAADSPSFTRACSGYSSFTGDLELGGQPLKVEWSFPVSQLGASGGATKKFDASLPCPDMMAFQDSCSLHWMGNATIRRTDGDGSDTEDQAEEPEPEQKKPLKRVGGHLTKNAKGAKVTVNCSGPCKGKISATAIATQRQAEKKVATEHFNTRQAGRKKVEVIFGGKGARTVRHRGGVIIDVKAAPKGGGPSQTKSFKLKTAK